MFTLILQLLVLAFFFLWLMYKYITLRSKLYFLEPELRSVRTENHSLQQNNIIQIKKIEQLQSSLEYKDQMILEIKKINHDSKNSVKSALFELGNDLSKQLIEIYKRENKDVRELTESNIKAVSEKFNSEFERLINIVAAIDKEMNQSKNTVDTIKNALLSPLGAGQLAEITLENILKASGLISGVDYIIQCVMTNSNQEEGITKIRPDAIVFLPAGTIMVIDAKSSKFLLNEKQDSKQLMKTMNLHLKSLSTKDYAENIKKIVMNNDSLVSKVITLMFIPSEHAIEKIIDLDASFLIKAWEDNIFLVGPSGLMNMLSLAKFQISEHLMTKNNQKIIEEVKKIINSISTITDYSQKLGKSITCVANYYDKFAASFNKSFLSKVDNITKLGIENSGKKGVKSLERFKLVSEYKIGSIIEDVNNFEKK